MALKGGNPSPYFEKALEIGRPPNIVRLFPNSRALIVSGKVIDRAMIAKGDAISIAANGRNYFVIRGSLLAAQKANAAIIIEIAKSEGGANAYCAVNFYNDRTLTLAFRNKGDKKMTEWEPKIVSFLCNWCSYGAADLAGIGRMVYPSNIRVVRIPCTGRMSPKFFLAALREGADGVWVSG